MVFSLISFFFRDDSLTEQKLVYSWHTLYIIREQKKVYIRYIIYNIYFTLREQNKANIRYIMNNISSILRE